MSFVIAAPEMMTAAATDLATIGSALTAAKAAAAAPTTGVLAAAEDEVSAAIAAVFSAHGQGFQALAAQAAAFHEQFVQALTAGAGSYVSAEAANVAAFTGNPAQTIQQDLLNLINAPALFGQQFTASVFDYRTPFGPLSLTLSGEASLLGTVTVTGGTLLVPTPFALAVDALGPGANVLITLGNGGAAFTHAVQTGNPVAAAEALLETPANAVGSFFFGQQTITESFAVPSGTQYTSGDISVPVGGLLAPLRPVTLTLFSSNGTVTSIPLGGREFGGLIPAIEGALSGS
jgi:hypothetical protein